MSIDKNRLKIQDGKLFIDGILTTIPTIESFVSVEGAGERGVVTFAIDILSRPVAVKIWMQSSNYSDNTVKEGLKEATKQANLEHPNILQVFHAGVCNNKRFYCVMKRLDGPTLREYLHDTRPLADRYALWFDIARAINYAHSNDIYHGDLHLGNIAVENDRAKVFDFGVSMSVANSSFLQQNECGQLKEIAKELFPEFEQDCLLLINPIKHKEYCADLVLCQLVAWITWEGEYLALKQVIKHRSWDDMSIMNIIFGIQIKICQAPLFNIDEILKRCAILETISDDEQPYMAMFLAGLYFECDRILRGDYKWVDSNPLKEIEDLKLKTRINWNNWQNNFISKGSSHFTRVVGKFFPFDENNVINLPLRFSGPVD